MESIGRIVVSPNGSGIYVSLGEQGLKPGIWEVQGGAGRLFLRYIGESAGEQDPAVSKEERDFVNFF